MLVAASEKVFGQSSSYDNFINAIRSPATRIVYVNSFKRYMRHLKITNVDDLLLHTEDKKLIEAQLIKYIMSLRQVAITNNYHTQL